MIRKVAITTNAVSYFFKKDFAPATFILVFWQVKKLSYLNPLKIIYFYIENY